VTFAKLGLVAHCERDGVPFVPWTDFDDVRRWLESEEALPGPVTPEPCPGWTVP
jgi:2-hydroxy-3-keto-5-methylthiopentenyl-1-phosphate phosphatase